MSYAIEMLNITKEFPGIKANDNVTLQVAQGEIHALLGENGAGKSTLMSILFGLYQPDEGQIKINGEPVEINDPNDANKYNIGMVHQHFKLVHNFTVLENIILGIEETKHTFIQKGAARKKVIELSQKYKLNVDPDALISDITVGMQQRVEILKMLFRDNNVLIFDEPTAVLTPQEIDELMIIMKDLAKEGKSIIFITHKLNEIKAVANRCTILRKGKYIGTVDVASTSAEKLSELMVGRKVNFIVEKDEPQIGDTVLEVRDLCYKPTHSSKNVLNNVSFEIEEGEFVGIMGRSGCGKTTLLKAVGMLDKPDDGTIYYKDKDTKDIYRAELARLRRTEIAFVFQDYYLMDSLSIKENIMLPLILDEADVQESKKKCEEMAEKFAIADLLDKKPYELSGGEKQRTAICRALIYNPDLILADEPTGNLDSASSEVVIHTLEEINKKMGKTILLVTHDPIIASSCDRIIFLKDGKVKEDLKRTGDKEQFYNEIITNWC